MVYYNEIDPFAAAWLRELIKAGHIAPGIVDERSIEDVKPYELLPYTQCHFFAGIGVWSYALREAGWPDDKPVWTGSCPCQPFSSAGTGGGFSDDRHLWPAFKWLIEERQPSVIFGEQVASKAAGPWIDVVHADLEGVGYAFGCVPFPSAGVGAPHIRDRAYWVAHTVREGPQELGGHRREPQPQGLTPSGPARRVEHPHHEHERPALHVPSGAGHTAGASKTRDPSPTKGRWRDADWLGCRDGRWRAVEPGTFPLVDGAPARVGRLRGYGNAINAQAAKEFIGAYVDAN